MLTVAVFAILVFAVSHIPVVRAMTRIADRFFCASDITVADFGPLRLNMLKRVLATGMVVFLVLINQAQVAITVRLNFFNRDFFNAIQEKNGPEFWRMLIWVFMPWAFIYVASAVIEYVISSYLVIRWRRWLTRFYIGHWLDGHAHYRMSLIGDMTDNPDQRISEDVARFIDGGAEGGAFGYGVYNYSIMLISTLSSLVSFAILLWSLSANFTFPGTNFALPGLLFWVALLYAATGTAITHLIGRPLTEIMFARQKAEADFRFSLARLREYSEQVALLNGEGEEQVGSARAFRRADRQLSRNDRPAQKARRLHRFLRPGQPDHSLRLCRALLFRRQDRAGRHDPDGSAFGQVEGALTFFISNYTSLAGFRAVLDRLDFLRRGHRGGAGGRRIQTSIPDAPAPALRHATIALPNGTPLLRSVDLGRRRGAICWSPGRPGAGKSTLFRALAGIWPLAPARSPPAPKAASCCCRKNPMCRSARCGRRSPIRPAKTFFPRGDQGGPDRGPLPELMEKLDETDNWPQRLSGGELQRGHRPGLLARPDWLLLDEATSALDEETEASIYAMLADRPAGHDAGLHRP